MDKMIGKVWVLGDDIDTDIIIPKEYLALKTIDDMKQYGFSPLRPELAALIEQGAEALSAHRQAEKNGVHSIALVNVCERLEFLYGHPVHLKVQSELGKGTAFLFDLPLVTKGGSTS